MKTYKLLALSVSAGGNRVLKKEANEEYPESLWGAAKAQELVTQGFLVAVEAKPLTPAQVKAAKIAAEEKAEKERIEAEEAQKLADKTTAEAKKLQEKADKEKTEADEADKKVKELDGGDGKDAETDPNEDLLNANKESNEGDGTEKEEDAETDPKKLEATRVVLYNKAVEIAKEKEVTAPNKNTGIKKLNAFIAANS